MASALAFDVEFEVVKKNAAPVSGGGSVYAYRRGIRRAHITASSSHPKDIAASVANNVTPGAGESIEILNVRSAAVASTEGQNVLS